MIQNELLTMSALRRELFSDMKRFTSSIISIVIIVGVAAISISAPQGVKVTGSVSIARSSGSAGDTLDSANAVTWLQPISDASNRPAVSTAHPHFKIIQQHKKFEPHILAVPVGSVVDFPNLDPFFHNVFSMFDGKRFDLGLYEAGTSHRVTFDAPGVCYIFCNIHPEMSAAVVVIDSPYYATTNKAGQFSILNVLPGSYMLNVWHERGKPEKPDQYPREVVISSENTVLPAIRLTDAGELLANHKNKYGKDYDHDTPPAYK
jgi:plastocyanin